MPERWPRLRCPDCGETEFTDKEWSDRAHVCPLYMEPTWRGLVQREPNLWGCSSNPPESGSTLQRYDGSDG